MLLSWSTLSRISFSSSISSFPMQLTRTSGPFHSAVILYSTATSGSHSLPTGHVQISARKWSSGGGSNSKRNEGFRHKKVGYEKQEYLPIRGSYEDDNIYGISSVLVALRSGKRNISELLTQEGMQLANKKDANAAVTIINLAKEKNICVKTLSKHDLNMLTENRPHQGFVLRAQPLKFQKKDCLEMVSSFKCVLALDEVWDPMNFGALLRTCYFLGVDEVVVCSKNSAPLSPTVSKASAGALEMMDVTSTDNMMRFLDKSQGNGWQVVGTALAEEAMELSNLPLDKPTILVLGNEGHGVRTNILKRCSHLIKITGSAKDSDSLVDSLNVSVTGGILLHHIMSRHSKKNIS